MLSKLLGGFRFKHKQLSFSFGGVLSENTCRLEGQLTTPSSGYAFVATTGPLIGIFSDSTNTTGLSRRGWAIISCASVSHGWAATLYTDGWLAELSCFGIARAASAPESLPSDSAPKLPAGSAQAYSTSGFGRRLPLRWLLSAEPIGAGDDLVNNQTAA